MGFGVVIAKLHFIAFGPEGTAINPVQTGRSVVLGISFAVVGLLTLLFAAINYDQTRRMIQDDIYQPLKRAILPFIFVVFLLGIATVAYLLSLGVPPHTHP